MAAGGGWSDLFPELLEEIWKRLEDTIDCVRFRSVCSNWRNPFHDVNDVNDVLPLFLPTFPHGPPKQGADRPIGEHFLANKHTFYLVRPLFEGLPWILRIREGADIDSFRMVNSEGNIDGMTAHNNFFDFNDVFNHLNLSVLPLATSYIPDQVGFEVVEKAAVSTLGEISLCLGKYKLEPFLYLFKDGLVNLQPVTPPHINGYTVTNTMDLCMFKNSIYAVDGKGCTLKMTMQNDLIEVIAQPFLPFGIYTKGRNKYLVVFNDKLLMVDLQPYFHDNEAIKVYFLQENQRTWYPMDATEDLIIFLGDDLSFACTVADLGIDQGNSVIFMDGPFRRYPYPNRPDEGMSMARLDGVIGTINPEISRLFWPPPAWTQNFRHPR